MYVCWSVVPPRPIYNSRYLIICCGGNSDNMTIAEGTLSLGVIDDNTAVRAGQ